MLNLRNHHSRIRVPLSSPRIYRLALLAIVAFRVILWLPPGYSPDGANSFAPRVLNPNPPLTSAFPWDPSLENGFPNPRIPAFLASLPTMLLGFVGPSAWVSQAVWLFLLYFLGSAFASAAAGELLPILRGKEWALILVGVQYQLSPTLMYGLQDTAAYGLPIGFYWGIPLLFYTFLKGQRDGNYWYGPLVGLSSLLFMTVFPTSVVLAPLIFALLLILAYQHSRSSRKLSRTGLYSLVASAWALLANLWWIVSEFQYGSDLLVSLRTSSPSASIQANHFAYVFLLNWSWPSVPPYLPYLGTTLAILGLASVLFLTACSIFAHQKTRGILTLYLTWLILLILIYSYGDPFGQFYLGLLRQSYLLNILRNPVRYTYLFGFFLSCLFAVGSLWIWQWTRSISYRLRSSIVRSATHFALALLLLTVVVLSSLPLINGDVLTNTLFTGTQVLPTFPVQHGVKIPEFYSQASEWIAENYPDARIMVFPEPDTWLSASSRLTWGYEGTSSIYQVLLPGSLVLNNAGTLTSPDFPAISSVYEMAASGGPPSTEHQLIPTNGTISLWPGFKNDNVTIEPDSQESSKLVWDVDTTRDYGSNGHQFTLSLPTLMSDSAYLSLWIRKSLEGDLFVTWGNGDGDVGWYQVATSLSDWHQVVLPALIAPPFNYNEKVGLRSFPQASHITFKFVQASVGVDQGGKIQIKGLNVYSADPKGIVFYFSSLGINLVVVDKSIQALQSDTVQDISSYSGVLKELGSALVATFGNVSIYRLSETPSKVVVVHNWTVTDNIMLAWNQKTGDSPFFVISSPISLTGSGSDVQSFRYEQLNPSSYEVHLSTNSSFVIVLLENYHVLWQAYVNGRPAGSHFVANGFANAWQIDETGNLKIEIVFRPVLTFVGTTKFSVLVAVAGAVLTLSGFRRGLRRLWRGWRVGNSGLCPKKTVEVAALHYLM